MSAPITCGEALPFFRTWENILRSEILLNTQEEFDQIPVLRDWIADNQESLEMYHVVGDDETGKEEVERFTDFDPSVRYDLYFFFPHVQKDEASQVLGKGPFPNLGIYLTKELSEMLLGAIENEIVATPDIGDYFEQAADNLRTWVKHFADQADSSSFETFVHNVVTPLTNTQKTLWDHLSVDEWEEDQAYRQIARTHIGPMFISTVELPVPRSMRSRHFAINRYETMVFGEAYDDDSWHNYRITHHLRKHAWLEHIQTCAQVTSFVNDLIDRNGDSQ